MHPHYTYDGPPLHVLHVNKCGGTAIRDALGDRLDPQGPVKLCDHFKSMDRHNTDDKFAFFVRDPVKRFASGFISCLRLERPRHDCMNHTEEEDLFFRTFWTPTMLGEALTHPDPERREYAHQSMQTMRHLPGLTKYVVSAEHVEEMRDAIFFVGRQEHLEDDFQAFLRKIGWKDSSTTLKGQDSVTAHASPESYAHLKQLSPLAVENLRHYYADDYKIIFKLIELGFLPESYGVKVAGPQANGNQHLLTG